MSGTRLFNRKMLAEATVLPAADCATCVCGASPQPTLHPRRHVSSSSTARHREPDTRPAISDRRYHRHGGNRYGYLRSGLRAVALCCLAGGDGGVVHGFLYHGATGGAGGSWVFKAPMPPLHASNAFTQAPTRSSTTARVGRGGLDMISSMFRWKRDPETSSVYVNIESPASNVRRISSSIIIDRPIEDVWGILTDYNRLADYVPNLTQSYTVPRPPAEKTKNGVRLFQEGAQNIIGFNFRASLTMDMEEVRENDDERFGQRKVKFKLVDSAMFKDFSGEWRMQCYSRMRTNCTDPATGQYLYTYSTRLFYMVTVKPKGPVPVGALEWRIREDVPTNLLAVKRVSEALPWDCQALDGDGQLVMPPSSSRTSATPWLDDETLEAYLPTPPAVMEQEQGAAIRVGARNV